MNEKKVVMEFSLNYFNSFQVTTPKSHTDLLSKLILMVLAGKSIRLTVALGPMASDCLE